MPTVNGHLASTPSNDTGPSATDGITSNTTPTITGITGAGDVVTVQINGKTYTTTAAADGTYSITVAAGDHLPDGTYTPVLTSTDAAGNTVSGNGTPFTLNTAIPSELAAITAVTNDMTNQPVQAGQIESHGTPTLSGTLTSAMAAGETLGVYDGSTLLGNATVRGDTWTYVTPALAYGHHLLSVAVSNSSSKGASSASFDVFSGAASTEVPVFLTVVDSTGALQGNLNSRDTTDEHALVLSGTLSGYLANAVGFVSIYDGSTLLGTHEIDPTDPSWFLTTSALSSGTHTLTVQYTNGAGVVDSNIGSFTVTVGAADGIMSQITTGSVPSLALTGDGQSLDLTAVSHAPISEVNLLGTGGANSLKLALSDVLQSGTDLFNSSNGWAGVTSGGRHQMVIDGNAADSVQLDAAGQAAHWSLVATTTHGGHSYNVYNNSASLA